MKHPIIRKPMSLQQYVWNMVHHYREHNICYDDDIASCVYYYAEFGDSSSKSHACAVGMMYPVELRRKFGEMDVHEIVQEFGLPVCGLSEDEMSACQSLHDSELLFDHDRNFVLKHIETNIQDIPEWYSLTFELPQDFVSDLEWIEEN